MDSEKFHYEVVAIFKQALAEWDWNRNPLEWEGLPAKVEAFFVKALQESLDRKSEYGGPIRCGQRWNMEEDGEAILYAQIPFFEEDGSYASSYELLSDALIRDAQNCDQGWLLAHHIAAIRKSLEVAEQKAIAMGWDVSFDP